MNDFTVTIGIIAEVQGATLTGPDGEKYGPPANIKYKLYLNDVNGTIKTGEWKTPNQVRPNCKNIIAAKAGDLCNVVKMATGEIRFSVTEWPWFKACA